MTKSKKPKLSMTAKPKHIIPHNHRLLIENAQAFAISAKYALQNVEPYDKKTRPSMIVPALVEAALSLELALKAVLLTKNSNVNDKSNKGHDLFKLYDSLSPEDKDTILSTFQQPDLSDVLTQQEVEQDLKDAANSFVDFRYLHEGNPNLLKGTPVVMLQIAKACIRIAAERTQAKDWQLI